MAKVITHEGIVVSVHGDTAHVRILQAGACHACQAQQMCASADNREKEMDAIMLEPMQEGDHVIVQVSQQMGWTAVTLAYVIPFILLIAGVALLTIWMDEAAAGTLSILAVGVWYMVLKLIDPKIKKHFTFTAYKNKQ